MSGMAWKKNISAVDEWWSKSRRADYVPNIRKCIGVGGLNEPHAKNIILFGDTIFPTWIAYTLAW